VLVYDLSPGYNGGLSGRELPAIVRGKRAVLSHRLPRRFVETFSRGRLLLNPRPYTVGFLTVLMMVALRVGIGWHFFQEGLSHKNDPKWTSEGFLRQAKGPLAEFYQQRLPGFHGWDQRLMTPLSGDEQAPAVPAAAAVEGTEEGVPANVAKQSPKPESSPVFGAWYSAAVHDWANRRKEIADFYAFTDEQTKRSEELLNTYSDRLGTLLLGYEADIRSYRHNLDRNRELAAQPGANNIPNRMTRVEKREKSPVGEQGATIDSNPAEWHAEAQALEAAFEKDIDGLATDAQRKLGPLPTPQTDLKKLDTVIPWVLLVGGACLVAGLFTRTAALVLALFLGSVILSQPPWIAGSVTMLFNYQLVEFIALLVLATSHVGRWGGLDFFVHHVLLRPFRSKAA
jgi:uncharacterized membrane protein YphA (DoxX/SURF4 family)